MGGGTVVDPQPRSRHRRFSKDVLERLESLRHGTPAEVLLQAYKALGPAPVREAVLRSRLSEAEARAAIEEVIEGGQIVLLEAGQPAPGSDVLAWEQGQWQVVTAKAAQEVESYHRSFPLRPGMPREELKSRLKITAPRLFNAAVRRWTAEGLLVESGSLVWRPGYSIRFTPQQQARIDSLLARFARSPFAPPSIKESQAEVGEDVYEALVGQGALFPVSADVVFRKQDYQQMVALVQKHFEREETLTAAQFRDQLNTSRRYVLALLEHLDAIGVTVRQGDVRRLRKSFNNR